MRVNNKDIVVNVQTIRRDKKKDQPEFGEICNYEIRVYNQKVSEVKCEYGSAVKLGKIMLDEFDKLADEHIHLLHIKEIERESIGCLNG